MRVCRDTTPPFRRRTTAQLSADAVLVDLELDLDPGEVRAATSVTVDRNGDAANAVDAYGD
jgi:hypothetical protein